MKLSADKKSTGRVKRFLKRTNMLTIPCQFSGFGDCMVRFVSVSETDKWNYKSYSYARVLNFEITIKKTGHVFSEDRIPSGWRESSRLRFFKKRKFMANLELNCMINKTNLPMFLKVVEIPGQAFSTDWAGKITYKFVD